MGSALNEFVSKVGVDFAELKKLLYDSSDMVDDSIKASKAFITAVVGKNNNEHIIDVVQGEFKELDADKDCSEYQKNMMKASLLLAWEEMEK